MVEEEVLDIQYPPPRLVVYTSFQPDVKASTTDPRIIALNRIRVTFVFMISPPSMRRSHLLVVYPYFYVPLDTG